MKKTTLTLITLAIFATSCNQMMRNEKEPQFIVAEKRISYAENRRVYHLEYSGNLCDCLFYQRNINVSRTVLVQYSPRDSVALSKMMLAYVDSISNGFAFLTNCPENVYNFSVQFYKSTRGSRRYLENRAYFHRHHNLEGRPLPTAAGRDFIGSVSLHRRDNGCWQVNIGRGTGRMREDLPFPDATFRCLRVIGDCECHWQRLDEYDAVLIFYWRLRISRLLKQQ